MRRLGQARPLRGVDEMVSRIHERTPHLRDRSIVSLLSGTWWVNSGADFDPANAVPVPAGGFVRRVARTPHYDGVMANAKEPAVIALFGMAPVDLDGKSTRLNSSHQIISYAVFCLKKKKTH